jgi:hypothetical protein
MLLGDEVALQEALREQEQIHAVAVRFGGEVLDPLQGRFGIAEELRGLARANPK